MIKTFEEFINENYSEKPVIALGEEYGAPLFNEISESLIAEIHNSINEGKLVIDMNMVEEGLFDSVANLFKKGADKMYKKEKDEKESMNDTITGIEYFTQLTKQSPNKSEYADEIETLAKQLQLFDKESKVYAAVKDLCNLAVDICEKISEKEENMYSTISEKMTAANEAIEEFTKKSIEKINEIVTKSKDSIYAIIATVTEFISKMIEFTTNALEAIGKGIVIGFTLPFIFAYSLLKGALKVCQTIANKVKDGAKVVGEVFDSLKTAISGWVSDMLTKAKNIIVESCEKVKDGAKNAYKSVAKSYLAIVAILGQLASDTKDAISKAYNDFVDGIKEFSDDVRAYVSEKWDTVSKWCKKTATSFADGVKNVWDKMKEKVTSAVSAVKDAYQTLKDNSEATWKEIQEWDDERKKEMFRAQLKYGVDEWGKDVVSDWLAAIQ
jgi:phage-related protein